MIVTLANLHEATAQQVFDQVATHLLKQNCQSLTKSGDPFSGCCYRGANKTKCAAGALIADSEYVPEMDNSMDATAWTNNVAKGLFPDTQHSRLINDLQLMHDTIEPPVWGSFLKSFAATNSLEFKEPV